MVPLLRRVEGAQNAGFVSLDGYSPRLGLPQGGSFVAQNGSTGSASGVTEGRGLQLSGGALASLVGVGLLLIFVVQNNQLVTLRFLIWSFTWPLWLLIIITASLGALVWFGLGVMRRHRRRVARREARER
jgi:uncharacterized integral membrane protein